MGTKSDKMVWHRSCYHIERDTMDKDNHKFKNSGFGKSIEGNQEWPPKIFHINVRDVPPNVIEQLEQQDIKAAPPQKMPEVC